MKILITHPSVSNVDGLLKKGEHDLDSKLANNLIKRGLAEEIEEVKIEEVKIEKKPTAKKIASKKDVKKD